jgi:hypothetical protein
MPSPFLIPYVELEEGILLDKVGCLRHAACLVQLTSQFIGADAAEPDAVICLRLYAGLAVIKSLTPFIAQAYQVVLHQFIQVLCKGSIRAGDREEAAELIRQQIDIQPVVGIPVCDPEGGAIIPDKYVFSRY